MLQDATVSGPPRGAPNPISPSLPLLSLPPQTSSCCSGHQAPISPACRHATDSDPTWLRAELHLPVLQDTTTSARAVRRSRRAQCGCLAEALLLKMDQVSVSLVEYFKNLIYSKYSSRREIQGSCFSKQLRAIEILLNLF
jgi:hypothetical protein